MGFGYGNLGFWIDDADRVFDSSWLTPNENNQLPLNDATGRMNKKQHRFKGVGQLVDEAHTAFIAPLQPTRRADRIRGV